MEKKVDQRILNCDWIGYSSAETSTKNTAGNQINMNVPVKVSVISLIIFYLDFNFEFIKKADNCRYASSKNIRLVNFILIALFSNYQLTTSSGKHLEKVSHVHIVPFCAN